MKKTIFIVAFCVILVSILFGQEPLFDVKNDVGTSIFTVYPDGIRIMGMSLNADDSNIWIDDSEGNNLFIASQDSVRFYLYEDDPSDESRGGFAIATVGSTSDEGGLNFLDLTPENYFIGHECGINITSGSYNSFIGYQSGKEDDTGSNNVFIGYNSGMNNTSGYRNVFIGNESGIANTTAWNNLIIGNQAGISNQTATNQFFIGNSAGNSLTDGYGNSFIGHSAGESSTDCHHNTFVGYYSGSDNLTGNNNVFLGYAAGKKSLGDENVLLGTYVSYNKVSGDKNVMLGSYAGYSNTTGSGNVFIGDHAGADELGSNKLYIENSDSTSALIYGEFDNNILNFNATVSIGSSLPNSKLSLSGTTDTNGITLGDDQTTPILLYHTTNALRVTAPNSRIQYGTAEYIQDGGPYETSFNSDLCPVTDNYYDLGTSGYRWDDVYATNGTIITSDERDKDNIVPIQYGLTDIMQLNPVSFNWKGKREENKKLGLIAQELLQVVPEVVKTHDKKVIDEETGEKQVVELDRMGVYYSDLIPVLIKGMQEQQKEIEELKEEIKKLKK
ncbi:MAG: hypothetical protein DRH89_04200 [Candidatus Cloacimonadota bacterium]|nr:MAG: hypothetical protein DRH89_04200 [Candidatus Cloacimonadota bacterium]